MTSSLSERFTGLYATPELVGRQDILDQIQDILSDSSPESKLIFLSGLGGIGKTRLLKRSLELARMLPNCRVAEDVLDFNHIDLHTPIGLVNSIFEILTPPFDCFQSYQSAYQALNRARLSGNVVELEKLRADATEKFDQDLRKLTGTHQVVLTMDTAERFVYGLPGWQDEIPLADAWTWLIEKLPGWQRVVVIVAGREEARPAIEKIKASRPTLVKEIQVGPFSLEESLEYFDKVAQLANSKREYHLAERLQNLPRDIKQGAHAYSLGRPILLSLLVDYLSFPGESNLPDLLRQAPSKQLDENDYRSFEEALFERLRDVELGETLIALGRAPKGVDDELLASLLDVPRAVARKRLMDVQNLSVVKIRPENQRTFLHDEVYALLQRLVYDSGYDALNQKKAFEAIKFYYSALKERNLQRLNELYAPVEELGRESLDMKTLGEAHTERQALLGEIMYYYLRDSLDRGFRAYYRFSHEAIMARDAQMDLQLQAELLSYLSRPPAPILEDGMAVDMVLANLKIRPVARFWADGKYAEGIETAHKLIEAVKKDWGGRFPVLLACAHAWTASLHLLRGKLDDKPEAQKHLAKVYLALPESDVLQPFAETYNPNAILWYEKAVLAMTYRVDGYRKRQLGFMKDAVTEYQKAAALLREVDLLIEMATTMNDMGFAQAELGEWHDGRANVTDALRIRRELGPRVPVALSLNTLAIIDVREGQYPAAREKSERALSIFRAFSFKRGIAMALTTLSEATRRQAGTGVLLSSDERIKLLREARDHAREAISLFQDLNETARQVEALIEIGSACRDWVWQLTNSPRSSDNLERIQKESENSLTQAAELAKKHGITYLRVDAEVNLAWLKYYLIGPDDEIADRHPLYTVIDETERAFPSESEMEKQPQVWAQKGKLYVLKGHLDYLQFEQQRKKEPKGISETLRGNLKNLASNYARGLEYSSRFSPDYQGMRQAKNGISDKLKPLNAAEMRVICDQIKILYPTGSIIQNFLTNRALWQSS